MKCNMKTILVLMIMSAPAVFAKGVTFNLMVGAGCQLDKFISEAQGATYKPAPPAYVKSNDSPSFMVNINSDSIDNFYIDYKIDCPSKNKSGYLTIGGDYYGWFYKYDIIDHATGMELYTVYEGYYNTKSSVIINIK